MHPSTHIRNERLERTLRHLMGQTIAAYNALVSGADSEAVYAALYVEYAEYGLDSDVAESAVDWYEMGPSLLAESLADAIQAAE
jgi:hypothetical protein